MIDASTLITDPDFWISVGVMAATYAIVGLGLQLNVGFCGILNFAAAGFMAIGAYSVAILSLDVGLPLPLAGVAAMAISVLAGLLVGLPSLRLRADYFAIVSIGIAEIIRHGALNLPDLTGGTQGLYCDGPRCFDDAWLTVSIEINRWIEGLGWKDPPQLLPLFIVAWAVALIAAGGLSVLQRTPWGRVLRAIREDEDAAEALGKNTFVYKIQALSIAALLGAVGGIVLALNLATVHPQDFKPIVTFYAYSVIILGGMASYWGVLLGSIIFWSLIESTRFLDLPVSESQEAAIRFAIVGAILVGVMTLRPQGLFGKREEMVLGD